MPDLFIYFLSAGGRFGRADRGPVRARADLGGDGRKEETAKAGSVLGGATVKSNRLDTMARFEGPKDPKVVFICPECMYEFCEGDPVEEVDGQNMCLDCADDWYASLRKSNKRVLEAEE